MIPSILKTAKSDLSAALVTPNFSAISSPVMG